MKTYVLAGLAGPLLFAGALSAQYSPLSYPSELPPEPLSYAGRYQCQKSSREFYEMWGAHFRAAEEAAVSAIRELRAARFAAIKLARKSDIEQTRTNNAARRAAHDQQVAARAQDLTSMIRSGTVQWPSALQNGWARGRIDELVDLLTAGKPIRGADAYRLMNIVAELRQAIREKRIGSNHNQRVEAAKVVGLLQSIATNSQRS